MPTPPIKYRHPEAARSTAAQVRKMKASDLARMKKDDALFCIREMGNEPVAGATRADLVAYMVEVAAMVNAETGQDVRDGYNDPAFRRVRFFDGVRDVQKAATEGYAKAHAEVADPARFYWGNASRLVEYSATLEACKRVLDWEDTGEGLDAVLAALTKEVVAKARFGVSRSTNAMSNVREEEYVKALAGLVEKEAWL